MEIRCQNPESLDKPPIRILRHHEVASRLGLSESKLFKLISDGDFPSPFLIVPNGRATGWLEHVVDGWILNRSKGGV
jgi:predicted DNA-binding transcriptional regulator AlpA